MKKRMAVIIIAGILIITMLTIYQREKILYEEQKKVYCTPESRMGEFCTANYEPVCGWFNETNMQCSTYPCGKTYSNSCFACLTEEIAYWTQGACPDAN
ncbi:MAG: hypothetical protein AABX53_00200 [Nanoarchaeota archaeon]